MSRHRAPHRPFFRTAPLGAGVTVALLAAGTGSAFAAPAEVAPTPSAECTAATTAVQTVQGKLALATTERDNARRSLRDARAVVANAQDRHDSALRKRNAVQNRVLSLTNQEKAKQLAFDNAKTRATTNPSPSAQRELARATRALTEAKNDTAAATANLATKQKELEAAPGATAAQRTSVSDAITRLNTAEANLAALKGERRSARDARDAACTTGILTAG